MIRIFRRRKNKYDFLDLGCKVGGSIEWNEVHNRGKGLGLDMDENFVNEARKRGYDVIHGDVLRTDFPAGSFRYISMMDFLEHMPNEEAVKQVLTKCKKWARDFFFIHHPSFEGVDYLKKFELKIDWTDGWGHTSPLKIKDFKRMFKELGLDNYHIKQRKPITDSSDRHIIPLSAPTDTIYYSKKLGPKKKMAFDKPVYSRVEIMVNLK